MKLLIHLLMLIDCGINLIVYLVWKHAVRRVNGSVRISLSPLLMILNSGSVQIRKEQMKMCTLSKSISMYGDTVTRTADY